MRVIFPPVDFVVNVAGWAALTIRSVGMGARKIANAVVARRIKYQRTGKMYVAHFRPQVSSNGWRRLQRYRFDNSGLDHCSLGDPDAGREGCSAIAAVKIDIDGVLIEIHGIRALHVPPAATRIELPTFRNAAGRSQAAVILPDEVRGPIGNAVLSELVEIGLAVKRPALTAPQFPEARTVSFGG